MRCRTTFYTALGRLLMVELGEDEERFERFMLPLTGQCQGADASFASMSANASLNVLLSEIGFILVFVLG